MTDEDATDRAAVRVFPPGVPLVAVLAGVGLQRLWPVSLPLAAPERYWIGGLVIASSIVGLGLWSVILFRRSGQDENPWKSTPAIVEQGPFRVTRNPMYLQMVLVCVGFSIVLANLWILLLAPVCALVLHFFCILPEEAYLERKFGEAYRVYKKRVRRWI